MQTNHLVAASRAFDAGKNADGHLQLRLAAMPNLKTRDCAYRMLCLDMRITRQWFNFRELGYKPKDRVAVPMDWQ